MVFVGKAHIVNGYNGTREQGVCFVLDREKKKGKLRNSTANDRRKLFIAPWGLTRVQLLNSGACSMVTPPRGAGNRPEVVWIEDDLSLELLLLAVVDPLETCACSHCSPALVGLASRLRRVRPRHLHPGLPRTEEEGWAHHSRKWVGSRTSCGFCRRRAWLGTSGDVGNHLGRPNNGCRICRAARCHWRHPYKGLKLQDRSMLVKDLDDITAGSDIYHLRCFWQPLTCSGQSQT